LTPNTPSITGNTYLTCLLYEELDQGKLLRKHGELGFILVHAYVSPTHATLSIKGGATRWLSTKKMDNRTNRERVTLLDQIAVAVFR
jgi:hypothetical protein